jgi:peptide/nickel transport system permease protein
MLPYLLRRLGFLILTVLLTSLLIFLITRWLPGDVCRIILGREAGAAAIRACHDDLRLDDPLPQRYLSWLGDTLRGEWGLSYSTKTPILPLVAQRAANSLRLAVLTLLIAVPLGIVLGILAALAAPGPLDGLVNLLTLAVVGQPEFVTGLVLIQLFSFEFRRRGWPALPANSSVRPEAGFFEVLPMLVLPALTATLVLLAYIARLTRAGVLEELHKNYVRTAELKGLPRRAVIVKHVLRNALLPTITVVAISFGWLISGLVVVENVYNYPGLGRLLVFAIDRRDLPLLQAVALVTVLAFALANLLADLLYAALNPRIRLGS